MNKNQSNHCPLDSDGTRLGPSDVPKGLFYLAMVPVIIAILNGTLTLKGPHAVHRAIVLSLIFFAAVLGFLCWFYFLRKCRPWVGFASYLIIFVILLWFIDRIRATFLKVKDDASSKNTTKDDDSLIHISVTNNNIPNKKDNAIVP